jgi:ubiquitin-protein ligase E3 C
LFLPLHNSDNDAEHLQTNIYSAFALNFLATTNLSEILGSLEEISRFVNMKLLSQALIFASSSASLLNISSGSRLWLLSQFIALHRFQEGTDQEPIYLKALSVILSASANEIVGRIDAVEQESHSEDDDENLVQPLPNFVRDQLKTLVNKQSITGLLAKFEM